MLILNCIERTTRYQFKNFLSAKNKKKGKEKETKAEEEKEKERDKKIKWYDKFDSNSQNIFKSFH